MGREKAMSNKPRPKPCPQCRRMMVVVKKVKMPCNEESRKERARWMLRCTVCNIAELGDFVED